MFNLLKFFFRSSQFFRGLLFKIQVILLGGQCKGLPRIAKGVNWKYPPHVGVVIDEGIDIGPGCYFDVPLGSHLHIGKNVKLTGCVYVACANKVKIGNDSLIAEFVSIRDSEHLIYKNIPISKQGMKTNKIDIGCDVWVGKGAMVLGGVVIHDGAVIGAHSLVKNAELEAFGIYVGSPAKKIKSRYIS